MGIVKRLGDNTELSTVERGSTRLTDPPLVMGLPLL